MNKSNVSKKTTNTSVKKDRSRVTHKKKYKVRNWKEYNESLVRRGSLDFWIEQGIAEVWQERGHIIIRKKRGAQRQYSDQAIELCRLVGKVFHQRLRQTEGFVRSIFNQACIELEVPDYSTLCRRGVHLPVHLPKQEKEKVVAILDSTGLKVYGEGEWKVRKHGYSKHRQWMKAHVSIDRDGEIRAVKLTDNSVDDATVGVELLRTHATDTIEAVEADGAYDKRMMYQACKDQRVSRILIPPRKDAKIWVHGNRLGEKHPRDENLRAIRTTTRKRWKQESGYHTRSKVETTMFRTKTIFGEKLMARSIENQITEVSLMTKALNLMLYNGMPESYAVVS